MKNLFAKYKSLPPKYQLGIASLVFVLGLVIFPNALIYALAAVVSFSLIKKKSLKYILTFLSIVLTLISLLLLVPESAETEKEKVNDSASIDTSHTDIEVKDTNQEIVTPTGSDSQTYEVMRVIDGDTLDVSMDGAVVRLRLIGMNTPETVDPRKPVECFGTEASQKATSLLLGKKVSLVSDSSQGEKDKYDRLLRYVFLEDGTNFNLQMIKEGYAYEYTYGTPYAYQAAFKEAQQQAKDASAGLWGAVCQDKADTSVLPTVQIVPMSTNVVFDSCTIKGNINTSGEKIYHMLGCDSYDATKIHESRGERWFCSEQEALDAGWQKAKNC
ncbi:MAG: thermonuclease family protein [Candidatus Pacebacteria bacterium]|nr:thermonuclease family protein [Candidatus Paceibacterota bacterium]